MTLKQTSSKYCHGTYLFGQPSLDFDPLPTEVLVLSDGFELRGGAATSGPMQVTRCKFGSFIKNSDEFLSIKVNETLT